MFFISRLINKRVDSLINRFNVPKVSPHIFDKIVIDNIQAKSKVSERSNRHAIKANHASS